MNSIETELLNRIAAEKKAVQSTTDEKLYQELASGDEVAVRGAVLFFTSPEGAGDRVDFLLKKISAEIGSASQALKSVYLKFLTYLSLDLLTFPAERVLLPKLGQAGVSAIAQRVLAALEDISKKESAASKELLSFLKTEALSRFKAEGITDAAQAAKLADELTGKGLKGFVDTIVLEAEKSNLRTAARAGLKGRLVTEVGNDYAEFLNYVIWLGGSFVTTNPVLIKLAWDIDPAFWNTRVDEVIAAQFSKKDLGTILAGDEAGKTAAIETVNTFVTIAVVERNCRLLRSIFLLTEGKQGYVSLQVNPKAHNDADKMVSEASMIYEELGKRLGGVPNVVIKVPSTAAGRKAAEKLTAKGIGVTVTLTFSLFQALPFAEVLQAGHALISYIAIMNGRLAFPVRDELKKNSVEDGVAASRWAGVEVARKAAREMYSPVEKGGLGVDKNKVKIMIASLRIYEDWIPDISELWGIPVITIFPNVRRAYDAHERDLEPDTVSGKTPPADLDIMVKSELFRQAWYTEKDKGYGKPDRPLSLEDKDAEAVAAFTPVNDTLTQFISMYKEMSKMVQDRMAVVARG